MVQSPCGQRLLPLGGEAAPKKADTFLQKNHCATEREQAP